MVWQLTASWPTRGGRRGLPRRRRTWSRVCCGPWPIKTGHDRARRVVRAAGHAAGRGGTSNRLTTSRAQTTWPRPWGRRPWPRWRDRRGEGRPGVLRGVSSRRWLAFCGSGQRRRDRCDHPVEGFGGWAGVAGRAGGPAVAGPVLWTRDRYSSRFAVVAPIDVVDLPVRWYLWDIDACGTRFHRAQRLLPHARGGVGGVAGRGRPDRFAGQRFSLRSMIRGCWPSCCPPSRILIARWESVAQFAEYHRCRRLAEVVKQAVPLRGARPGGGLDVPPRRPNSSRGCAPVVGRSCRRMWTSWPRTRRIPGGLTNVSAPVHGLLPAPGRAGACCTAQLLPRRLPPASW